MTETQLRRYGYREVRESERERRRLRALAVRDLRERETELRELTRRLGEAGARLYEEDGKLDGDALDRARMLDDLLLETQRSVRLAKATVAYLG